jgi:hypothetical protein
VSAGPPDIVVDYSAAWTQVSIGDDIDSWAPAAAEQLWAAAGQPYSVVPCFGAFIFCPDLSRGPRAVVRLNALRYAAGFADEEIIEELLLPDAQQLLRPEVEHLAGAGLRRLRIRQRAYTDEDRTVADYIAYVVPFEEGAWALSVSFPDPRDAERWLPELDALSAGVQLQATL